MAAAGIRVAVLGGGVGGSSAASRLNRLGAQVTLLEMGRGTGGRVATRRTREDKRIEVDHGAPAADIMTPEGAAMAQELCDKGFIEAVSEPVGHFEPGASIVQADQAERGVLHFKGKPAMSRWCEGMLDGSTVMTKFGNMVRGFEVIQDGEGSVAGWRLLDKDKTVIQECDWLIVTSAGVAHSRWTKNFGGPPPLREGAADLKDPKLDVVFEAIEGGTTRPVQVAFLGFEGDAAVAWSALPFYIGKIDGDKVVGKIVVQRRNGMVFVAVHSTHEFAADNTDAFGSSSTAARVGAANDGAREQEVLAELMKGLDRCVDGFDPRPSTGSASFGPLLHRWASAFPDGSIFASPGDGFAPASRLLFAGDFVGPRNGSIEGAMLSGTAAAEMLIEHVSK